MLAPPFITPIVQLFYMPVYEDSKGIVYQKTVSAGAVGVEYNSRNGTVFAVEHKEFPHGSNGIWSGSDTCCGNSGLQKRTRESTYYGGGCWSGLGHCRHLPSLAILGGRT